MGAIFIACYPRPTDGTTAHFDMDYYLKKHMPLQLKMHGPYGLRSYHVIEPTADSPYVVQTIEFWDSVEGMEKAIAEASEETYADIKNYTNITNAFPIKGTIQGSYVEKGFVLS
ncbi:hypothetical protein NX059_000537 [Plenodomus lindquistii]|nr:hypothetical protein NX059_000537 [Plenodomus lindquistii]